MEQGYLLERIQKLVDQYDGTVRYDTASQSPVATFTIQSTDMKVKCEWQGITSGYLHGLVRQ